MLTDPDVRDPWAAQIASLARRGVGRRPFEVSGGLLAVMEMPRLQRNAFVVPVELNGEPALAMIATGNSEVYVDSADASEGRWVSLRFGERIEVKDVPALAQDLSGVSRLLGAPIKMTIGTNLLRRLRPTIDLMGRQFVVRTYEPPPPPQVVTLPLNYLRGGGMQILGAVGSGERLTPASFLIDTGISEALALDAAGWEKAGVDVGSFSRPTESGGLQTGVLPRFQMGTTELKQVEGVLGAPWKR